MGADGDISAYAWYRATVKVPKAGTYRFQPTEAGDWVSLFVNGRHVASGPAKQPLSVTLPAGTETLAVLTAHNGRPKLAGYLGPIDHADNKGLSGPVVLAAGEAQSQAVTAWRVKRDDAPDRAHPPTDTTGAGWSDATTGPDVFNHQPGFAWYRATLSAASDANHRLHFENVDDNGTVYLNGKKIGAHEGWGVPFDVSLDTAWREGVPNELAVLVENTAGTGGIQGPVTLQTVAAGSEIPVQGWKMRGGPGQHGSRRLEGAVRRFHRRRRSSLVSRRVCDDAARRDGAAPYSAPANNGPVTRLCLAQRPQPGPLS